jgi:hypothetical protein
MNHVGNDDIPWRGIRKPLFTWLLASLIPFRLLAAVVHHELHRSLKPVYKFSNLLRLGGGEDQKEANQDSVQVRQEIRASTTNCGPAGTCSVGNQSQYVSNQCNQYWEDIAVLAARNGR